MLERHAANALCVAPVPRISYHHAWLYGTTALTRMVPAHTQDVVAGDGTTSVVVICGSLLKKTQELLDKGVHPTVVSDAFNKAAMKVRHMQKRSNSGKITPHAYQLCFSGFSLG